MSADDRELARDCWAAIATLSAAEAETPEWLASAAIALKPAQLPGPGTAQGEGGA